MTLMMQTAAMMIMTNLAVGKPRNIHGIPQCYFQFLTFAFLDASIVIIVVIYEYKI